MKYLFAYLVDGEAVTFEAKDKAERDGKLAELTEMGIKPVISSVCEWQPVPKLAPKQVIKEPTVVSVKETVVPVKETIVPVKETIAPVKETAVPVKAPVVQVIKQKTVKKWYNIAWVTFGMKGRYIPCLAMDENGKDLKYDLGDNVLVPIVNESGATELKHGFVVYAASRSFEQCKEIAKEFGAKLPRINSRYTAPRKNDERPDDKHYKIVYVSFGKSKYYAYGTFLDLQFGDNVWAPVEMQKKHAVVIGSKWMTVPEIMELAKAVGRKKLSRIEEKYEDR